MLANYVKLSIRNLSKNKGYSFLNIFGLSIGITCAALIFLWVEDELNFNSYFPNGENIYKVKDHQTYDGTTFTFDSSPGPLAAGMKSDIPGIKNTARCTWNSNTLFSIDEKAIYEKGQYVDPAFLSIFKLEFIKGNPATALNQHESVVISEKMALQFFSNTDVIGKTIVLDKEQPVQITGVIRDLPKNVFLQADWLAPFQLYEKKNEWLKGWGNNGLLTFAELSPSADVNAINKKLYNYVTEKSQGSNAKMSLYPMSRWRLYDTFENGKEVPGRIKYVKLFSLIAWIILLIACINFMNLATARSEKRAREVGVRKVLGAGKGRLIGQFIGESLVMATVAGLVALALIYLCLPAFNGLVEKKLLTDIFKPEHAGALLLITVLCGLLAGSYPAFYLSSFNPVAVLKGVRVGSGVGAGLVRKGLVILQFSISVILIISTIIIYQQIQHAKNRQLGYDKNSLVCMNVTGDLRKNFDIVRQELQQKANVQNASLSSNTTLQLGSNTGDFTWDEKDPNKQVLITLEGVSPQYISTMGMHIKEGRDFYPDAKSDSNDVIINEAFAKLINRKQIIGTTISRGDEKVTIVGVIHDFIYNNLYGPGAPLVLYTDMVDTRVLSLRFKPGADLTASIAVMERVIKTYNPGYPVDYKFLDEGFERYFKTETLIGKLAGIFATLAILISCLGLFGLAAYTAERRTKEIGIRKVLGASIKGLTGLLSKEFIQLVTISCLIAFPLAWWMMQNWLQDYEYRIKISWIIFVLAGLLALIIALFTVSFQAIKAALANPVKSLRSE